MRRGREGRLRSRERSQLFDTAEPNAISFSQSAIDSSRLGDAHFGTPYEWRRIRGIGISVSHKTSGISFFVNDGSKYPAIRSRITESLLQKSLDSMAFSP